MAGTRESGSDFEKPDESKDLMGFDKNSQNRQMRNKQLAALQAMKAAESNNMVGYDRHRQRAIAWEYLARLHGEINELEPEEEELIG